ncbi:helix-turn-helix transcriptional regulator [Aurantibacillus circumpalustris]|uniref:helix-turn-helix transcriptional regulator n=1 Tax=Aurantibacillus circumpalustris TaxID=3036359 RepID=UPI00295BE1C4|nr:helix-turn-helix transcriptional regulator [Aurantibacillus circumpalustris]
MSEITNIYSHSQSDSAILKTLSAYIKHHRLEQNKSQSQLALEAGINRSTLIEFEKGKHANLITFIQLLRALNLLSVLNSFQINQQISPLILAEAEMAKRKRASKTKPQPKKPKSNW